MPSDNPFSTYAASKQAEIIAKLMELFKGNSRGFGLGEIKGAKFNEDKNKWIPGGVRWQWGAASEAEWRLHLTGLRFLGIGPILDDSTVWFSCIDVDRTQDNIDYEFDYADEMGKIKRSGFPLIVYRTKSGGLRVTIFFSEPVEAELAIKRMKQIAAQLGYAGQEIFPKQSKLDVEHGDCPSWIYLPYGPIGENQFPEQCCMNESGNAMDLYESVIHAMRMRISKQKFYDLFVAEISAKSNGRANGKKHPKGKWVDPNGGESYEDSVKTMFWDGPICLWHISLEKSTHDQHYFLLNCGIFLKRKYPENWDKALEWVNFNVLRPTGDIAKLEIMIKDLKNRGDRPYEYTCKNPPICNRCHAHACKKQPFGVGQGNGVDHYELALTVWNSKPQIFFTNVGQERIACNAQELESLKLYRKKCLEYTLSFPDMMPQREWDRIIKYSLENATIVDPPELLKTNANEIAILQRFFGAHIPRSVRAWGNDYLSGKGKPDDLVRIREKEGRIYFKFDGFENFCRRSFNMGKKEFQDFRMYISEKGQWHDRTESLGGWYRSTFSMDMGLFNEDVVKRWLNGGEWEEDDAR